MATLRRKHLSRGTYFIWRCEHKNGQHDRVSDRNEGPHQAECEVELTDAPTYPHLRHVAQIELAEVMSEFDAHMQSIGSRLDAILQELRRKTE